MNLLHLQYFYVVAKEQGFTKASKALRIQQPAISRMVKLLEEDLGLRLLEKIGRNVRLTKAGQDVFEYCIKIFGTVEELKSSVGQIGGECRGPLMLAAAEPIASHYLPVIFKTYLAKFPKVYPNLFSGPASMLFDKIIKGELEMGLFYHIPEMSEKLEVFETLDTRYHLVIRKDLKRKSDIIERFIGSREIDDISTKKFPTLERLKKDYPKASITISSNNLTAHKEMVLQGLGVSILPEFLVHQEIKTGVLADLYPNERFNFKMKFIKRKTAVLTLAAGSLVKECIKI
jgi:DNA-binding transcriptional LysR family regulator